MFHRIDERFNIEVINFGESNDRVLVFRLLNASIDEPWEKIEGTRALLIGGEPARLEMKRMLDSRMGGLTRASLNEAIPGGIKGRSHTAMRKYFGL